MLKKVSIFLTICLLLGNISVGASASSLKDQGENAFSFLNSDRKLSDPVDRLKQNTNTNRNSALRCPIGPNNLSKDDREIKKNLEEYLNAVAQNRNFHGAVLVEKGGRIILDKGYGMANYEKNIPNTNKTRFAIASITKQFTAMAIMQLYEKGKLKLEDRLSKYFPDFPRGDEITIHQLLTHTSGITNYTNLPEFWTIQPENMTEDALVNLLKTKPLDFNPGENWSYSNSGYLLLGVIVEKVSGRSLENYLEKNIFRPLGMNDTGVCFKKDKITLKTVGYVGFLDVQPIDDTLVFKGLYGAGYLYSTVEDLYRWDRALYTCKLVSKKSLDLIFTPHVDTKAVGYYGYGWMIQGEGSDKEVFHDGAALGFNGIISRYVGRDTGIIILSNNNYQNSGVYKIESDINAILLGQEVELPVAKKAITLDSTILDGLVGTYEVIPGFDFIITREGTHMYAQVTGQEKIEIFAESETEFFYRLIEAEISFIKNEKGEVIALVLHQNGMDYGAMKVNPATNEQVLQMAS